MLAKDFPTTESFKPVGDFDDIYRMPTLKNPEPLPGDCDVKSYVLENITRYDGDSSFLAAPTERTLESWKRCEELMKLEEERGGILDADTKTASTIVSHKPGYVLSPEKDLIVGLQTDYPLKRACKPRGGFRVVEAALQSYGYEADETMRATYGTGGPVETHNNIVFSKLLRTIFQYSNLLFDLSYTTHRFRQQACTQKLCASLDTRTF